MTGRAEALERYQALALPTTSDEHWRFTDLTGFDPDGWAVDGDTGIASPPTMLELEVAGAANVGEGAIEIVSAPEGVRFEPLPEDHELLYSLVGWDEKFAAHNAALWRNGLLVHVPQDVELERPLYVRIANAVEGGSLFWRLLVVAEPRSRSSRSTPRPPPSSGRTRTRPSRSS
jgi:Fe-S cluster assembly protein SufD